MFKMQLDNFWNQIFQKDLDSLETKSDSFEDKVEHADQNNIPTHTIYKALNNEVFYEEFHQ